MPDITMCTATTCPSRHICYRHAASGTKPTPYRQSMASFKYDAATGRCDVYSPTWFVTPYELYTHAMATLDEQRDAILKNLNKPHQEAAEIMDQRNKVEQKFAATRNDRVGTSIFRSMYAAEKYYGQMFEDATGAVKEKLCAGEIGIDSNPANHFKSGYWDDDDRWHVHHLEFQYQALTKAGVDLSNDRIVPLRAAHRELCTAAYHYRLLSKLDPAKFVVITGKPTESDLKAGEQHVEGKVAGFRQQHYCCDGRPIYSADYMARSVIDSEVRYIMRYAGPRGTSYVVITKEVKPATSTHWGLGLATKYQYIVFSPDRHLDPQVFKSRAAFLRSVNNA